MSGRQGALMLGGTASGVGKSLLVTGLCRVLARQGVSVAPFKGQTVAHNSMVTGAGSEISRAQYTQAVAARTEPEAAMNPVLLKPNDDGSNEVVVLGQHWQTLDTAGYHAHREALVAPVLDALEDLRRRFDVVLCEGAGSPTEFEQGTDDIVNLGLASRAGVPAVIVGDIDRGGLFVNLQGTVDRLPEDLRACVRGFVINRFHGDPEMLADAITMLAQLTGVPTLGIMPSLLGVKLDAEDGTNLVTYDDGWGDGPFDTGGDALDVVVIHFPSIADVTDFDPLRLEPCVRLRYVDRPAELAFADLVILPGTKATVADLAWMRRRGLVSALEARLRSGSPPVVLGVGGGYQMLGGELRDPHGLEGPPGVAEGLGLLAMATEFDRAKVLARRRGVDPAGGVVTGYEIHRGRSARGGAAPPLFTFDSPPAGPEGMRDDAAGVYGTSLHAMFESDEARADFLHVVSLRRGKQWQRSKLAFAAEREAQLERLADACQSHLDLEALWALAVGAATVPVAP